MPPRTSREACVGTTLLARFAAAVLAIVTAAVTNAGILQATYLGGNGDEVLTAMVVHPATGEIIVAGYTRSLDLCSIVAGTCTGSVQPAHALDSGGIDGYLARFSPDLTQLRQLTYFGGNGDDIISSLAVNPASGDIYAAGYTHSLDLPCTTGGATCAPAQPQHAIDGAKWDGFVVRLSSDLKTLRQRTYFGGIDDDVISALTINPVNGEVIAAGSTRSTDLPCTEGGVGICGAGFASTHAADGGLNDGFLVRLTDDLTQFIETTYFGGSRDDLINAVAMNPVTGEIVVAGQSTSRNLNCPKGPCSFSFYGLGAVDVYYGFVARFTPDLWSLGRASILMAFADVTFSALAVNPVTGDVYVGGNTTSTSFPGTQPDMTVASLGAQPLHAADGGKPDAIIAWLSSDLLIIQQSTWFGGDNGDYIGGMAIDPRSGDVLVTGYTFSSYLPCVTPPGPCAIAPQATHASDGGDLDGFVARVSSDLRQFQQTTYLGGNGADGFYAVAVHPASGDVITAGFTRSTNLACTTAGNGCANAPQPSHAPDFGKYDGYLARITSDMASIDRTPVPFAFAPIGNAPLSTLTTSAPVQITGIVDAAPVRIEGALGTAYCVSSAPACTCDVNGGFTASPGTLLNGQYVCVRHVSSTAPDQISASLFHAGTGAATFRVRTASTFDGGCSLDVDGNGAIDALTDGVMLIRAMSGLTGTAVTANAIGAHSARTTWAQIQAYLNGSCGTAFQP